MNAFARVHGRPRRAALILATLGGAAALVAGAALPAAADAPAGNHVYQIYTSAGLLMDPAQSSVSYITQNTFTGSSTQDWTFVPVLGQANAYQIENYSDGYCVYFTQSTLYPAYGSVFQQACTQSSADEWFFVAAAPGSPNTTYSIQSVELPSFAITYFPSSGAGTYLEARVLDGAGVAGGDQSFSLFDLAG